jgi:hypothetical protein
LLVLAGCIAVCILHMIATGTVDETAVAYRHLFGLE